MTAMASIPSRSSFPRSAPRATTRGEEIEQARVIKWSHKVEVRKAMPALRWLHHSPNGGKRDAMAGAQMKALGVKKGFPDLILPVVCGLANGLVIEMKSATGSTSPEQKEWLAHFEAQRWEIRIARSASEARSHLCLYLGIDPNSVLALED
jgi:hypothetical protein